MEQPPPLDDKANANSELRYIALELTKLSYRHKKPFKAMASEFVGNVYDLESILRQLPAKKPSKAKMPRE